MNRLILAASLLAATALAGYAVWHDSEGEEPATVTAPSDRPVPPVPVAIVRPPPVMPMPQDFPGLAREIQRELKRVGCYRGEINGMWTPSTRMAMNAFIAKVNAMLPIDKPDQVLLSLVRGHKDVVCGPTPDAVTSSSTTAAATGTSSAASASSAIETATITVEDKPPPPRDTPSTTIPDEHARAPEREPPRPAETAALDDEPPTATAQEGELIPPPAVLDRRPQRSTRAQRNRPPKVVRTLIRNIKRGLSQLGIR